MGKVVPSQLDRQLDISKEEFKPDWVIPDFQCSITYRSGTETNSERVDLDKIESQIFEKKEDQDKEGEKRAVKVEQEVDVMILNIRKGWHSSEKRKVETYIREKDEEEKSPEEPKNEDMFKPNPIQNKFVYIQPPKVKPSSEFQSKPLAGLHNMVMETSIVCNDKDLHQTVNMNESQ